jgi:hypothetical protein
VEGLHHILDKNAYDHLLFVMVLCAVYAIHDWRKILILITAFTIGHSITLALATLRIISIKIELVEFLIPLTILVTAILNLFTKEDRNYSKGNMVQTNYWLALFFGLIHGMGFSNYLRMLLGKEKSIFTPLLSFNIGLEVGQIIIVAIFMVASFILTDIFGVSRRDWRLIVSSAIGGIALILMRDAIYW